MKENSRWILLLLALSLLAGGWFLRRSENLARVQFEGARQQWRQQLFPAAVEGFQQLLTDFPDTSYAPRALWEIASIYYYSLDDVDRARTAYQRLVDRYPDDSLAMEGRLKLAELYEREYGDLAAARRQWQKALAGELDPDRRRRIELKVADTFLYASRLDEALQRLQKLVVDDDEIARQARVRIGTIFQIRKEHSRAVSTFRQVVDGPDCGQCRLQARLALIESYEVLDQLPSAIRVARGIDSSRYPGELKEGLIARLLSKQRSFRPRLFNAD